MGKIRGRIVDILPCNLPYSQYRGTIRSQHKIAFRNIRHEIENLLCISSNPLRRTWIMLSHYLPDIFLGFPVWRDIGKIANSGPTDCHEISVLHNAPPVSFSRPVACTTPPIPVRISVTVVQYFCERVNREGQLSGDGDEPASG